jgi:signal recognition particle subunit SRP54
MFESLTDKLELTFKRLRGQGKISEKNIEEASFLDAVKTKALGQDVLLSLTPDQQFIKIVKDELTSLLGEEHVDLDLKGAPPLVIMLVGLQGSGKTTTLAKLAGYLEKQKKRKPYLVPADVYRPAAIEQLQILGRELGLPVHDSHPETPPVVICQESLEEAKGQFRDILLIDTAGRLHIDTELMEELKSIKEALRPHHILMVADAMTGQDAVNQAQGFNEWLDMTGIILTKLDGDARGGAALSMRTMVGKPILFSGRILGMGDVLSLIEKAQSAFEDKEAARLEKLTKKSEFSLEDFLDQLQQIKKMGSIGDLMDLIPGAKKLTQKTDLGQVENELKHVEAIIHSMTKHERRNPAILNGSRRRRIAQGSGTTVTEVNRLMKQYLQMKKMMQRVNKLGPRALFGRMANPFQ